MCRHLAYLGPPLSLHELLLAPPRSLVTQASDSRLGTEKVNADGFGAGWYDAERAEPARYRRSIPIWTDLSFRSLAGVVRSGAILAAIRAATPGYPVEESCTAPFTDGPWLFSHNGSVRDTTVLRKQQPDPLPAEAIAPVDSALVFGAVMGELAQGASPGAALTTVVARIRESSRGRLNLLLTDGHRVAATAAGNSLFTIERGGGVLVASEPHDDDPAWRAVPDNTLVEFSTGTTPVLTPLPELPR